MSADPELERLYDAHAQALFAFLLNLTRDLDETREVLQEVFLKLARQPDLLTPVRDERGFLLRLAHHLAIDRMRRRSARARREEDFAAEAGSVFTPTLDADEHAFREALSAALAELPVEQRVVVHLKLWEAMTFDAIAQTLGISLNTAASRYRYGLDKLRQRLRPLYEEMR
jgi:RNA polymerase sigma-70 factor (ECF subfamily)